MFAFMFLIVSLLIGFVFISTVISGFRTSRMVNKVFLLAEQEIDRKLHGAANFAGNSGQTGANRCERCGRKVTAASAQCSSCGAELPS